MVGPLVYDLALQHQAELRAERDMDRLAANVPANHSRSAVLDTLLKALRPTHGPRQQWRSPGVA